MNKYNQIKLIGSGYFCDVIKCEDTSNNRKVALKKLKAEHISNDDHRYRLNREITLLEKLAGCNYIIELLEYNSNKETNELWYVMPYADYNLHAFIKKYNSSLTEKDRFHIINCVIEAIKFAHNLKILHRDLSPNNVLIFKNDTSINIKVSDFGLGKDIESTSYYTASSVNNYGQILYVSPEQREHLKNSTNKSDIYSLGKLIYFIITGKDPQDFKTNQLSILIKKCICENPEDRFETIDELDKFYSDIKKMILDDRVPETYIMLTDIMKIQSDINWILFHKRALEAKIIDHPFSDYIDPIIEIFRVSNRINQYYEAIGSAIVDFLNKFVEVLRDCYGMTGWPFKAMNGFGSFLYSVFITVDEPETKLICLKEIWNLAYEADQWHVQSIIENIFKNHTIPSEIEIEFALHIKESNIHSDLANIMRYANSMILKNAIAEKSNSKSM